MYRIIAADIGGTNSRFSCFFADEEQQLNQQKAVWIKTDSVNSFSELIEKVNSEDIPFAIEEADIVAIGAAGPVERGVYCKPPYIDWEIDLTNATKDFGIRNFVLMNDFVAQAYASQTPLAEAAQVLVGPAEPFTVGATIGVIGAGTNLGKAMLVRSGKHLIALPSEGGHSSFPAQSVEEAQFLSFVAVKLAVPYVTCENIVSGRGLSLVHQFLTGETLEPEEVTARFGADSKTLEWCSRFYGRVCRNFALESLCLGGLFVAGGVAAKVPLLIAHDAFSAEFCESPKHERLLKQISVRLIENEESGLWGAAFEGLQVLRGK